MDDMISYDSTRQPHVEPFRASYDEDKSKEIIEEDLEVQSYEDSEEEEKISMQ